MKFAHVAISCADMRAVEAFYTRHFGMRRARVCPLPDGGEIVFLKGSGVYLELFAAEGERPIPAAGGDGPHYPGVRHLAFQVDDVDAALATMGSDATVTLGPASFDDVIPGWKTVWVADPEGNIVEISEGYRDEEHFAEGGDSMNTREVVEQYFDAVNRGDWERWLTLFDEHLVMDEQLAGHIEGTAGLRGAVEMIQKANRTFNNYPLEIVVEGEKAMVVWNIKAVTTAGAAIDLKGANLFRVRDGKIVYMANFHDTAPFAAPVPAAAGA